jgi:hypothetical protein
LGRRGCGRGWAPLTRRGGAAAIAIAIAVAVASPGSCGAVIFVFVFVFELVVFVSHGRLLAVADLE